MPTKVRRTLAEDGNFLIGVIDFKNIKM